MESGQYSLLLILALSPTLPLLFALATALFLANQAAKQNKAKTQLAQIRAILKTFETSSSGSHADQSDSSLIALLVKNDYLKVKYLLAKQRIHALKLKHQPFDDFNQIVERGRQGAEPIERSEKSAALTIGDLLDIGEEDENWFQPTLTPTKSQTHTSERKTSFSTSPPHADKSQSHAIQAERVDNSVEVRSLSSGPEIKADQPGDSTLVQFRDYEYDEIFDHRRRDNTPSRRSKKVAVALGESLVTAPEHTADEELLKSCHARYFPPDSFSTDHWSGHVLANSFQDSYDTVNGSESTLGRQITIDQQGMRSPNKAITPQKLEGHQYDKSETSSGAPTTASISTEISIAPKAERYHTSPYVFKYPCYYMAPLSIPKDELLRTVIISGIPTETKLENVMDRVRGGLVVSCTLLNTIPITGTNTVMIAFFRGESAKKYVEFANQHADEIFNFGTAEEPKIIVSLVQSPTTYLTDIHIGIMQQQWSRHLVLNGIPETMSLAMIRSKIGSAECTAARDGVLSMWRKPDHGSARLCNTDEHGGTDCVHILFSSIVAGHRAFSRIMADDRTVLGKCQSWCEPDPCDAPVEELIPGSEVETEILMNNGNVS